MQGIIIIVITTVGRTQITTEVHMVIMLLGYKMEWVLAEWALAEWVLAEWALAEWVLMVVVVGVHHHLLLT
jgi:hypothetical protein